MPEVRLDAVLKKYGDKPAVNSVSLVAPEGKLTTILGPSGSGKSTTVRLIAGLEQPDAGDIWLGERPVFLTEKGDLVPSEKREIGMVFQSYALWPHKRVAENVAFPLRTRGTSSTDIRHRVREALALVRLAGFEERFPGQLSGGEQQRVALARALVYRPQILLLDEPLANLDATNRESLRFELREMQQRIGITTIYVTHDQSEAMVLSDLLVVMNHGRIAQSGLPLDVFDRPNDLFVAGFLGVSNLLPATIIRTGVAMLDDNREVLFSSEISSGNALPGQKVVLSIRPHQLRLVSALHPATNTALRGTVRRRVCHGPMTECWVETGSITLRLQSLGREGAQVGETVSVLVDPRDVRVLKRDEHI